MPHQLKFSQVVDYDSGKLIQRNVNSYNLIADVMQSFVPADSADNRKCCLNEFLRKSACLCRSGFAQAGAISRKWIVPA